LDGALYPKPVKRPVKIAAFKHQLAALRGFDFRVGPVLLH